MKIAIDTTPLSSGHRDRGVGVYTSHLIDALKKYVPSNTYYEISHISGMPADTDMLHVPYFDPFFLTIPFRAPKPLILTIHDLTPVLFPDHFPRGVKGEIKWRIQKFLLRSVNRVLTDSATSKSDIIRLTGMPGTRVDTVYLAPVLGDVSPASRTDMNVFRKDNNISGEFILYVGDVNWNKNVKNLIMSFSGIVSTDPNITLVCIGKAFQNTSLAEVVEIRDLIKRLGIERHIVFPGYVGNTILASLYDTAQCVVVPSMYEGFGFSLVDALARGCPVVVSDVASLSELAGPASVRIHPQDVSDMEQGIRRVLSMSDSVKKKNAAEGKEWVKRYNWRKTAENTAASYKKLLS